MNNEIEGIVLSSIDYKESSKIVYLYTNIGNISVKALKSKKIKGGDLGFITTGNIVSFIITNNEFPTLIEYHLKESLFDLSYDIKKLNALSIILSLLKNIPDDSPHNLIYPLVSKYISELKNKNEKKILAIILIKLLYAFGVNPILKECIKCKGKDVIDFIPRVGGALCSNCTNHKSETLKYWKYYYYQKEDIETYPDCDFDLLLNEIKIYYQFHLSIKINLL